MTLIVLLEVMTLIFNNADKAFQFAWCRGYDLSSISELRGAKVNGMVRLCYMTTEIYRVYLVYDESARFSWRPYTYRENAWRLVPQHSWKVRAVEEGDLVSEKALFKALEFQMVCQWRSSVEGWHDELPSPESVRACLGDAPTTQTLDYFRINYYEVEVQHDPEWDGAIQVLCSTGTLLFPYWDDPDGGPRKLVTKYTTFIPDSRVEQAVTGGARFIDRIVSAVQNLRWTNFRLLVDNIGGTHGK